MITKNIREKVGLIVLLFSLMIFSGSKIYASDSKLEIPLSIVQTFKVENISPEKVNQIGIYKLSAMNSETPMPEDSIDGNYIFSIKGNNKQVTIPLEYVHGGIYSYKLQQITEDTKNYVYDRTSYTITVYIKNGEGGQLIPLVIVEDENGEKCGEIIFKNLYKGKSNPQLQEDPPDPQSNPSTSDQSNVTMWLLLVLSSLTALGVIYRIRKHLS